MAAASVVACVTRIEILYGRSKCFRSLARLRRRPGTAALAVRCFLPRQVSGGDVRRRVRARFRDFFPRYLKKNK